MNREQALEKFYELERKYNFDIDSIPDDNPQLKEIHEWYHKDASSNSAKKKYDWEAIQFDLNKGLKKSEIIIQHNISSSSLRYGIQKGIIDDTQWRKVINRRYVKFQAMEKRELKKQLEREKQSKYDWIEVQKLLDKGMAKTDICGVFSMPTGVLKTAVEDKLVDDSIWKTLSVKVKARKSYLKHKKKSGGEK